MFGNFIYFIIALLIYVTHHPTEETSFTPFETFGLFTGLILIFAFFTWIQFHRLERRIEKLHLFHTSTRLPSVISIPKKEGVLAQKSPAHLPSWKIEGFSSLDHDFNLILTRQFVIALLIFTMDIYGLNLTSFTANIPLLTLIPTCQALIFLGLFAGYVGIVWACAYGAYQKLYAEELTRRSYVVSNILFSVPILLPWLLLSGIADLINALPYEQPKGFLATTEGEVSFFLFFLFAVAVVGPVMIRAFWRCKPLEPGYDRTRIEDLCQRAGMGYANILCWPIFGGKMITAGVMGLVRRFRYILVTDGLLNYLDSEEIDAVIAHEIGHIKKRHLLFYLFFFAGYMFLSYATFDLIACLIFYIEPVFQFITEAGVSQVAVMSAIFSVINILIFLIYFRYVFGYFMRNFEREADTYVYTLFDSAQPLISTFEKITRTSGQPPDKPNWHHFSIAERMEYLRKCEADRRWIARHGQKIRKSMAVYLVGICLIGGIGYHLNFSDVGERLSHHFLETAIHREIERNPEKPELYSTLGDICHNRKNYEGAIAAYQKSLHLKPDAHVLNNLAWLFATCEEERLRHPERALDLAQKASALDPSPHILDTLAESHYVNGQFEEAISAARRALEASQENRPYYEGQLEKFLEMNQFAVPPSGGLAPPEGGTAN